MSLTDFNDLHSTQGIGAVREQLLSAMARPSEESLPADEAPPAPADSGGVGDRPALEECLKRFALIFGETKVYDFRLKKVLKQSGVKATVGNEVFKGWMDHADRRTVTWTEVNGYQSDPDKTDPISLMLDRFVYVYPTDDAWDQQLQNIVPLKALKSLMPVEYVRWLEHPRRRVITQDQLVFDPTQRSNPETTINTFSGLPLEPDASARASGYGACSNIRALLGHLCNGDGDIVHWVTCWLAYPLQNVGSKLDTALLFHSDVQGSGKSVFFGLVMRPIYGKWGAELGQHQLESPYTDWRSRILYAVFEEVLSRTEKHNQMGTIKHMITGTTMRVEKKFVSGWEEANHMNGVFLSNEIQPFPLEPSDRRFMVVWPRKPLPENHQAAVSHEIANGGIEAFYQYLLDYDLNKFSPHTKPLDTEARKRVIEFGLPNFEVFWRDWKQGDLEVPYSVCLTRDLYRLYQGWCKQTGNRPLTETKLMTIYSSRVDKVRKHYRAIGIEGRQGTFFVPDGCGVPDNQVEADWFGSCVVDFRKRAFGVDGDDPQ